MLAQAAELLEPVGAGLPGCPDSEAEAWALSSAWAGPSAGDERPWPSPWPALGYVLCLGALGSVFPTSDLRHGATTPAHLVLGQALAQCPVRSADDLSRGLLVTSTLLGYVAPAKRVAPEALAFLTSALLLFADLDAPATGAVAAASVPVSAPASVPVSSGRKRRRGLADVGSHALALPTFSAAAPLSRWLRGSLAKLAGGALLDAVPAPLPLGPAPRPSPAAVDAIAAVTRAAPASEALGAGAVVGAAPVVAVSGVSGKKTSKADKTAAKAEKAAAKAEAKAAEVAEAKAAEASEWELLEAAVAADGAGGGGDFAMAALGACLRLVCAAAAPLARSRAFAELFEAMHVALHLLRNSPRLRAPAVGGNAAATASVTVNPLDAAPTATGAAPTATLGELLAAAESAVGGGVAMCLRERQPMRWQAVSKADRAVVSLAPRLEERFDGNKRDAKAAPGTAASAREEEKRLRKELKKEEKGASRELRRDAAFLGRLRDEERHAAQSEAREARHRNFGWLEEQQATLNLQVRKGRGLAGGGSSIKKSVAAVLKSGKRQK